MTLRQVYLKSKTKVSVFPPYFATKTTTLKESSFQSPYLTL